MDRKRESKREREKEEDLTRVWDAAEVFFGHKVKVRVCVCVRES